MARRRAFVRGAAAISQKRLTTWFQFQPVTLNPSATGTLIFSLNAAALAFTPFTIVRSHFELQLRSDQAAAIEQQSIGFGIAVVSDEAVAVGVSAIPTPIANAASDLWFLHRFLFGDESALTDRTRSATRASIDSKAMRKVSEGQDVAVVVESSAAVGGGTTLDVAGRMLIKVN